jgi:DNA gyrase/topoisomerase IV subunit A
LLRVEPFSHCVKPENAATCSNIDEFIAIIRNAPTPPVAKAELISRPWDSSLVREMLTRTRDDGQTVNADDYRPDGLEKSFGMGSDGLYRLSEVQAQEILQMRLQRLTGLEQDKIVAEYKEVIAEIDDLLNILSQPQRVTTIIELELSAIKQEFGQTKLGARRSQIEHSSFDLSTEDLITPTDMVVTLSHAGYIKSQPLSEYRAQKRGGRGKQATATKEDDWVDQLFVANTHDYILCFSDRGRLYSRSGRLRLAHGVHAGGPSSTCFRCKTAKKSPLSCRLLDLQEAFLRTSLCSWRRRWEPSKKRRWTISTTRARAASSRWLWTTAIF